MLREDEQTEFKKTTGELNEAMLSISSILNKHGRGKIYFGLKNNGQPCKFEITDSTLRDVSRKIFETIKPQIFPIIKLEKIDDVEVIVVEFDGADKPYSAFGKYYIRIADEDRELSPSELRKIMIGREYEDNYENRTSAESLDEIDLNTVQSFYHQATDCNRLPNLGKLEDLSTIDLLRSLSLVNADKLNNAGRLLFSKNKPLVLKLAVFATNEKNTFLDSKRVEGNIFELIDVAMDFVVKNLRFRIEGIKDDLKTRNEVPEIPLLALREAVINCFAHAKYDLNIQHEIDIFSDRIAISNPGSFASEFEPIDYAYRQLNSHLRNQLIANTLYLCKDVETFGTGFKKIYNLCNQEGLKVAYENRTNDFTFEIFRPTTQELTAELTNNAKLQSSKNKLLTDKELEVLAKLRLSPKISSTTLAKECNIPLRTVYRIIKSLKDKQLIVREGSNKAGFYKVL